MYKKEERLFKYGCKINYKDKLRLKMKNRSHRYDINKPRPSMDPSILDIKCVSV